MISDRNLLVLASVGLVPIALSYGAAPSVTLPLLIDILVEDTNLTHVFRAVMGLYLANVVFWLVGALRPSLTRPAIMSMFLFMAGLATGRVLSLVLDGVPNAVLVFYLLAEIAFASLAFISLHRK